MVDVNGDVVRRGFVDKCPQALIRDDRALCPGVR